MYFCNSQTILMVFNFFLRDLDGFFRLKYKILCSRRKRSTRTTNTEVQNGMQRKAFYIARQPTRFYGQDKLEAEFESWKKSNIWSRLALMSKVTKSLVWRKAGYLFELWFEVGLIFI